MASRKRRLSLDMETAEAVENINATMQQLHEIWERISMDEQARVKRVRNAYSHLRQLLSDMVEGEERMAENIIVDIRKNTETVLKMRREMELEPFPLEDFEENSVALWKALDANLKELKRQGEMRRDKEADLKKQLNEFARKLDNDSLIGNIKYASSQSRVPTTGELAHLESRLADLQTLFSSRLSELLLLQSELLRETNQMNYQALGKEVREFLESDLADVDVLPSTRIEELRKWSSNVKEEYVRWAEDAQFRYLELHSHIKELWDKCYVSEMERCFPEQFDPEIQTNEDIEALEAEVKRLDRCLEERRAIYANINRWKSLWKEKCEFEEKSSVDRNFYNNRGGQLQVILKRQQEVDRSLPRVQREVENALSAYRLTHPGEEVLIDGVSPTEYVEMTIEQHRQEKDRRRMEKIAAKREMSPGYLSPQKSKSTTRLNRMTPPTSPLMAHRARNMSESSLRKIATPVASPLASPVGSPRIRRSPRSPFSPIHNRTFRKSSKSPKMSPASVRKGIHGVRRNIPFK
ncbi:hypothetical protein QR680_017665 [Steinernema hermaphroditum]|uniref:Protein regulator of cytokinesis 1 n=1 Tax=Steinernema hermaphroditum TaxID=289476 RepID=A0AA39HG13_9BILA|nr:hypothetical protein QR680_017665 [Steinernema hermaphroditum]